MLRTKHLIKYFKFLTDTSIIQLSKEYNGSKTISLGELICTFIDSLYCKIRYKISAKEYLYFSFKNKSSFARKTFIGEIESTYKLAYIINKGKKGLFAVKSNTYNAYKPYFKRDLICIEMPSEKQALKDFAFTHDGFIIKPVTSCQGKGIRIIDWNHNEKEKDIEELLEDLSKDGDNKKYVIEELIDQDPLMASFHPYSVNTIRYAVFYNNGKVVKLFAIIRMGVGDNRVDNTHAGGICAAIDLDSGIIISEGVRQNGDGEKFIFHPDKGTQIIGTKIPKWEELNKMVEELAPHNSSVKMVGWDFALSKNGWCIVEGNPCPSFMGIQGSTGTGYRKLFMDIVSMSRK